MANLSPNEFQRAFRLSRTAFQYLLNLIQDKLKKNEAKASNSSGSPVLPVTKLACTLRFLAGGSFEDISALFGVSRSNLFKILWETMEAIDSNIDIALDTSEENLSKISQEFSEFNNGHMKGCIMAIDGWVCKTRQPTFSEVGGSITTYRNRKNCWGLVVLAGCDAKCKFTMVSVKSSGSTNDCIAWDWCDFKDYLDSGILPTQYYVIGDEAFTCTNQFLVPYGGHGIGLEKDSFNYHLSSMRQCIERAFGLLTKRWGIFWRELSCNFKRWPLIIMVCCKLHNICIDFNDSIQSRLYKDILEDDQWEVLENNNSVDRELIAPAQGASGNKRREITAYLDLQGFRRPQYAQANSRAN
jgi:hypothetical protein